VSLSVTPEGDVRGSLGGDVRLLTAKKGGNNAAAAPVRLQKPKPSTKWALQVC